MTTEINAGDDLSCLRCSFRNRASDQFCASCGEAILLRRSMPPVPPQPPPIGSTRPHGKPADSALGIPPAQRDATTRYLCAAAHLDSAFSDPAIAEFLIEPVRAIPPAPGVDSAAVLRDAVAAHARRRIRDAVLLLLLVVLAFVNLSALLLWLIVALVGSVGRATGVTSYPGTVFAQSLGAATAGRWRNIAVFAMLAVAGIFLLPQLLSLGLFGAPPSGLYGVLPDSSIFSYGTLLIAMLALAVIGIDEFTVHHLVYTRFRRGSFVPDGRDTSSAWERAVRTLGHASFHQPLARVATAHEGETQSRNLADVVVHRGFSPFIGAGTRIHRKIIPLPLEPAAKTDADAPEVTLGSNRAPSAS